MVTRFEYASSATPLDPDEAAGLLARHITTQAELNEWEQANILEGLHWALKQGKRDLLDETFARELHRRMFSKTWKWAGQFRKTDKNIGVDFKSYPPDELALRFHHRLVWIHPFANGNGRHARLMADLLNARLGQPAFSWGGQALVSAGEKRRAYLEALRAADACDYQPLLKFARSR